MTVLKIMIMCVFSIQETAIPISVLVFYSGIERDEDSGFSGFLSGALFGEFSIWENSPQQNVAILAL